MRKKLLAFLLCLTLAAASFSAMALPAYAASNQKASESCIALLKQLEGFLAKPTWDYSQWSVGYGSAISQDDERFARYQEEGISEEEADQLLRTYITDFEVSINWFASKNGLALSQNQFDALILFSYNVGTGWIFGNGEFRSAVINQKTGNTFLEAITSWCVAGGKIHAGLIKRRLCEANVYFNGVYSTSQPSQYCYVLYNPNGGSCTTSLHAFEASNPISQMPTPSRSGCEFLGWYNASSGGSKITALSSEINGRTLFAHWQTTSGEVVEPTKPEIKEVNYQREVTVSSSLSVREEPSTSASVLKSLHNGDVVTIVAETTVDGMLWGKLESGGWIALQYTKAYEKPSEPSEPSQPEQPPEETGTTVQVTGDLVNVRSGAGTGYPVVGSVRSGQKLTITETQDVSSGGTTAKWGKIQNSGWICLTYTDYQAAQQPETPSGGGGNTLTGIVTASSLRIRSAAGTNASTVGYYSKGTTVTVVEQTVLDGVYWGRTDKGWICLSYVKDTSGSSNPSGGGESGGKSVKVTADAVNVRSGAGTNYGIVNAVYRGQTVTVTETASVNGTTWGKISSGGWICLQYTDYNGASSEPQEPHTPSGSDSFSGTVTASSLCIRQSPGTAGALIGTYSKGTTVTILEQTVLDGVYWGKTDKGWVCLSYVKDSRNQSGSTATYTVTGDVVNVRSGAGLSYGVQTTVRRGTQVVIVATASANGMNWGQLSTGGWISMNYLK